MKLLTRNLTEFEYLPYAGESDIDPETGRHTGEPIPTYSDPIPCEGNISTPSLLTNSTFYGEDIRYTHTLVMEPPDADEARVNEYGLIRWKGDTYEIRAVRRSLNYLALALRKQTANRAEEEGYGADAEDDSD